MDSEVQNNASKMMITALWWVKRGYAKAITEQYDAVVPTDQDFQENTKQEDDEMDDETDNLPDLGEGYIQPDKESNAGEGEDDEDMIPQEDYPQMVKDDNSDDEEDVIRKSDALIVTACAERDYSTLEVYLYEEEVSNLYVHHEIMLNAYPLWIEWIKYVPGESTQINNKGNFVAVGTFGTAIEIWNLDQVDVVEPYITLGGETEAGKNLPLKSMKAKKRKKYYNEGSHIDSVLCLSIHPTEVNYLASGSADKTVKIWDISNQKCVRDIKNHKDKVQVLEWNKQDPNMILSAGFDGKGVVTNSKNPNEKIYMQFENTEIESGLWNPLDQNQWYFSFENGEVKGYDIRNPENALFDFKAHEQQCTSISSCKANKNLLATACIDGHVSIWDLSEIDSFTPKCVQSKNLKVGGLFACQFYDDSPWIIAAGGIKGELAIWDLEESELVVKRFQGEDAFNELKKQEKELGLEGRASPEPANDSEEDDNSERLDHEEDMDDEDEKQ